MRKVIAALLVGLLAMNVSVAHAQDATQGDEKLQTLMTQLVKVYEGEGSAEEYDNLMKMSDELLASDSFGLEQFQAVNTVGRVLEMKGEYDRAKQIYGGLKKAVGGVEGDLGTQMLAAVESSITKLEMIGQPMEVVGKTVAGDDFSMEQYKGKVVLVDFWATWCGPCIAELPNVKENYEKYHDKGLEIVGVSLDDAESQEAVKKFLDEKGISWVNLFSSDPEATGWKHPLATKYGVNSIPATYLVNREGKVIALNVRGEALGAKLAEVFGESGDE